MESTALLGQQQEQAECAMHGLQIVILMIVWVSSINQCDAAYYISTILLFLEWLLLLYEIHTCFGIYMLRLYTSLYYNSIHLTLLNSTVCTWLSSCLTRLHSTLALYLTLYYTLLDSILDSAWLYYGYTWLYLPLLCTWLCNDFTSDSTPLYCACMAILEQSKNHISLIKQG